MSIDSFSNQTLQLLKDCLFWLIQTKIMLKGMKPKRIVKNVNVITSAKNVYDQPIASNTRQYEKTKKLTTGQGEGLTTGCWLPYDYIKNTSVFEQSKRIRC